MTAIVLDAKGKQSIIKLKRLNTTFETGIRQALYAIGRQLNRDLRNGLKQRPLRSGIAYNVTQKKGLKRLSGRARRGSRGRNVHIASTPSEFPARLNGQLRDTIGYDVTGSQRLTIGSARTEKPKSKFLPYAGFLEKRNHFIEKTINNNRREMEQFLGTKVQLELRKG